MILRKNGITYNLTDKIQIDAFISSGWIVSGKEQGEFDDMTDEDLAQTDLTDSADSQFDDMTDEELAQYSVEHGIDISKAKSRAAIIKLLMK